MRLVDAERIEEFAIKEMIDRIIDKLELVVEKMKVVGHSNGYWTIEEHEQIIDWLKELKLYRLAIKQCKESSYMVNSKEFARHMEELKTLKELGGILLIGKTVEDYAKEIRNKAIDKFIDALEYDFGTDDEVVIEMYDLRETAKQLKAGAVDD